jgi:two-component SAPR family response regulator
VADACKSLLEPEFHVVGIVTHGRSLIHSAVELKPDIIILDIHMPHLNGLDAGGQVKQQLPGVKLVFLTNVPRCWSVVGFTAQYLAVMLDSFRHCSSAQLRWTTGPLIAAYVSDKQH